MKPLRIPMCLALLLLLCACRESKPLPPGNWVGRCGPNPDPNVAAHYGPPPTKYVIDKAGILAKRYADALEKALSDYQVESCHQLLVVSVPSLDGKTLDDYARDYANRVGLGYRGLNNGVMLLLSPQTSQARIQVGCGLEDVVSDAQAAAIMQGDLLPGLREGSTQQGVLAAVDTLVKLTRKKTIDKQYRPDGCR